MRNAEGKAGKRRAAALYDRSILLDEREGPPLVRGALVFGAVITALFVLWAAFVSLEEIELAPGEIVPAEEVLRIQHPSGGILVSEPVREGSIVEAGDCLLRMDPADIQNQRAQFGAQISSLLAQRERILALAENRAPDFSFLPPDAQTFALNQRSLYETSRTQASIALDILAGQVQQALLEEDRVAARRGGLGRRIALAEEDLALSRNLEGRGLAVRNEVLVKERALEELREELATVEAEALRAQARAEEARDKAKEERAGQQKQLQAELASVEERLAQARASQSRFETSANRLDVLAPTAGVVHAVNYRSIGAVVPPGAVVLELIPTGKAPRAQIRLDPKSIGSVRLDMDARIKVSSYPYDRYGAFRGKITALSPATFNGPDGKPYYRATLSIDGRELADAVALDLVPGMTLTAELATGRKTLLQYLLKPIFASAKEAFREK